MWIHLLSRSHLAVPAPCILWETAGKSNHRNRWKRSGNRWKRWKRWLTNHLSTGCLASKWQCPSPALGTWRTALQNIGSSEFTLSSPHSAMRHKSKLSRFLWYFKTIAPGQKVLVGTFDLLSCSTSHLTSHLRFCETIEMLYLQFLSFTPLFASRPANSQPWNAVATLPTAVEQPQFQQFQQFQWPRPQDWTRPTGLHWFQASHNEQRYSIL